MSENLTFEVALSELEEVIGLLEAGQLPLEEAIESYKKGLDRVNFCQKILKEIEGDLNILEEDELKPFSIGE